MNIMAGVNETEMFHTKKKRFISKVNIFMPVRGITVCVNAQCTHFNEKIITVAEIL